MEFGMARRRIDELEEILRGKDQVIEHLEGELAEHQQEIDLIFQESMEAGADLRYESFIGGFSPDYYRRILERKLTE
jgi:hypothetical protein